MIQQYLLNVNENATVFILQDEAAAVWGLTPCLVSKNFQNSSSHRIFIHMHEALNVDENKN